jgi:hypothetical protein
MTPENHVRVAVHYMAASKPFEHDFGRVAIRQYGG